MAVVHNQAFMQHFWELAVLDPAIRAQASLNLVKYLKSKGDQSNELDYAWKRLAKGLASSKDGARPGFSVALTSVLREFHSIGLVELWELVLKNMEFRPDMKRGEEKDVLFGHIFAIGSMLQSGRLQAEIAALDDLGKSEKKEKTKALFKKLVCPVIKDLLSMAEKKSYAGEICFSVLQQLLSKSATEPNITKKQFNKYVLDLCKPYFDRDPTDWSPETVHLSLVLHNLYEFEINSVSAYWQPGRVIQTAHLNSLRVILMFAAMNAPLVNKIWDAIVDDMMATEDPEIIVANFWATVVADLQRGSNNQMLIFYYLLEKVVARLTSSQVSVVFTKPTVRHLITALRSRKHGLHKTAKQVWQLLEEKSKADPEFAMAVVTAIQTQEPKFDQLTATKSLRTLLGLISGDAAKDYIRKLIDHFYQAIDKLPGQTDEQAMEMADDNQAAEKSDDEDDEELGPAGGRTASPYDDEVVIAKGEITRLRYHRRTFAVNQIFSIARGYGPVFRDPEIQKACVRWLFFHAFYAYDAAAEDNGLNDSEIAPYKRVLKPGLERGIRKLCRDRALGLLSTYTINEKNRKATELRRQKVAAENEELEAKGEKPKPLPKKITMKKSDVQDGLDESIWVEIIYEFQKKADHSAACKAWTTLEEEPAEVLANTYKTAKQIHSDLKKAKKSGKEDLANVLRGFELILMQLAIAFRTNPEELTTHTQDVLKVAEEFTKNGLPAPNDAAHANFPHIPKMASRKKKLNKKAKEAAAAAGKEVNEVEEEEFNEWAAAKSLTVDKEDQVPSPMDVLTEVFVALLVSSSALLREAILNIWSNVFVRYVTPTSLGILLDALTQHEADLIAPRTDDEKAFLASDEEPEDEDGSDDDSDDAGSEDDEKEEEEAPLFFEDKKKDNSVVVPNFKKSKMKVVESEDSSDSSDEDSDDEDATEKSSKSNKSSKSSKTDKTDNSEMSISKSGASKSSKKSSKAGSDEDSDAESGAESSAKKSEKDGSDSSDSSDSEGLGDEEMFKLDAAMAKSMKMLVKKQKRVYNKQLKAQRLAMVNFKCRIMDMLDLYITKNPTDPKLFTILKALIDQFEHSVNWKDTKTVMNRIQSSLGRIYKFKSLPHGDNVSGESVNALISHLFHRAVKAKSRVFVRIVGSAILFLVKILVKAKDSKDKKAAMSDATNWGLVDLKMFSASASKSMASFCKNHKTSIKIDFFEEMMAHSPLLSWALVDPIAENIKASRPGKTKSDLWQLYEKVCSKKGWENNGFDKFKAAVPEMRETFLNIIDDDKIRPLQKRHVMKSMGHIFRATIKHLDNNIAEAQELFQTGPIVEKLSELLKRTDRVSTARSIRGMVIAFTGDHKIAQVPSKKDARAYKAQVEREQAAAAKAARPPGSTPPEEKEGYIPVGRELAKKLKKERKVLKKQRLLEEKERKAALQPKRDKWKYDKNKERNKLRKEQAKQTGAGKKSGPPKSPKSPRSQKSQE